jgi:hypothetical protein
MTMWTRLDRILKIERILGLNYDMLTTEDICNLSSDNDKEKARWRYYKNFYR